MTGFEDLKLLRAFVRIAESGSISAAARALSVSQPTLSRQLGQLERNAGVVLVRRDTHAMSLTGAGERLLSEARELLSHAEIASERMRAERDGLQGHIRIVAVLDSGQWIVPRLLAQFRREHPRTMLKLEIDHYQFGPLVPPKVFEPYLDSPVNIRPLAELRRALEE